MGEGGRGNIAPQHPAVVKLAGCEAEGRAPAFAFAIAFEPQHPAFVKLALSRPKAEHLLLHEWATGALQSTRPLFFWCSLRPQKDKICQRQGAEDEMQMQRRMLKA